MTISRLTAACLAGLFAAGAAHAQTPLYSNGPFVTHPGGHVSGADVSLTQDVTYPGYTARGITAGPDWRLADDFVVPAGKIWTITGARLFAFQPNVAGAFTDARVIIWRGPPEAFGSVKVFDGTVANVLVSSTPGAYRTAESVQMTAPFTDTSRRVQNLDIAIPETTLVGGVYFLDWQLTGAQAGLVYTPPVTRLGRPFTSFGGIALQKCPPTPTNDDCPVNLWRVFEIANQYLVDLPFELNGTSFDDSIFTDGFDPPPDDDDDP